MTRWSFKAPPPLISSVLNHPSPHVPEKIGIDLSTDFLWVGLDGVGGGGQWFCSRGCMLFKTGGGYFVPAWSWTILLSFPCDRKQKGKLVFVAFC